MNVTVMRQLVIALLFVWAPASAGAQDYPNRTIEIIVPVPPGVTLDMLPRTIADKLAARWSQPVIIMNRPGASQNIGAEAVANAAPDGYTLLAAPPAPLVINQALYPALRFDPNAFTPVTVMATTPNVLVASPQAPFSTLQGMIAFAKANPGKLSYASPGVGSTPHLAMELLKSEAGIDIVHIPYKGLLPTDLLAGHVDVMFNNLGNTLPLIESGALKLLAVGSEKRLAALPDAPAISEMFPRFVATTWFAIVAPPKTPPEIAAKLSQAIAEIIRTPEVERKIRDLSMTPVGSTPAETAAFIREERERWHKVIVSAGIKPD